MSPATALARSRVELFCIWRGMARSERTIAMQLATEQLENLRRHGFDVVARPAPKKRKVRK